MEKVAESVKVAQSGMANCRTLAAGRGKSPHSSYANPRDSGTVVNSIFMATMYASTKEHTLENSKHVNRAIDCSLTKWKQIGNMRR